MEANGVWMSILDYAQFKNISISSIRRYIKAGRVENKLENGKFFIFVSGEKLARAEKAPDSEGRELLNLRLENQRLKNQMRELREEVDELRMLVNLYEMKSPPITPKAENSLPDLPALPSDI